ncbi:WRKY Transcription Factor [Asimina triloba]
MGGGRASKGCEDNDADVCDHQRQHTWHVPRAEDPFLVQSNAAPSACTTGTSQFPSLTLHTIYILQPSCTPKPLSLLHTKDRALSLPLQSQALSLSPQKEKTTKEKRKNPTIKANPRLSFTVSPSPFLTTAMSENRDHAPSYHYPFSNHHAFYTQDPASSQPHSIRDLHGFNPSTTYMSFTDCLNDSVDYGMLSRAFDPSNSSPDVFGAADSGVTANELVESAGPSGGNPTTPNSSVSSSSTEAANEEDSSKCKKDEQVKGSEDGTERSKKV